eukprot:scaffold249385_cov60-Cyclotella_meneghiniana.AAC.1
MILQLAIAIVYTTSNSKPCSWGTLSIIDTQPLKLGRFDSQIRTYTINSPTEPSPHTTFVVRWDKETSKGDTSLLFSSKPLKPWALLRQRGRQKPEEY